MLPFKMQSVILVGAGFAGITYWIPAISRSASFRLVGVIDPDKCACRRAAEAVPGIWTAIRVDAVSPLDLDKHRAIVFVATPDHLSVIREFSNHGFRKFIVEKPLVSSYSEVDELEQCIRRDNLKIYSIDHYYQKFLPLEFVLGRLALKDPRVQFLEFHGDHRRDEIPGLLGLVEGVSYANIEAGDLGIPHLDTHPWLEYDPTIGGMLRDLGPHAFAPLIRTGLTSDEATIMDIGLAKLNTARDGFTPVRLPSDIEMWVRALITWNGITANVAFGKAPFPGRESSLAVRAANGIFFASLASGQSSILMTNDGRTTRLSLCKAQRDLVLEEAIAFFNRKLPADFDGNLHSSISALHFNQRLRTRYLEVIK